MYSNALLVAWWAYDLRVHVLGPLENEVMLAVMVLGFFAILNKFVGTAPEIRPSNLRHFHYMPAEEHPAMRAKLEVGRAQLFDALAKR